MVSGYNPQTDLKVPYRVALTFVLAANQNKYFLGSTQQLNKPSIRLNKIIVPFNSNNTVDSTGNTIASAAAYYNTFVTLQDPISNNIVQQERLSEYIQNTDVKPERQFNQQQIDFTKSFIELTVPGGDVGKVIEIIIEYFDVPLV